MVIKKVENWDHYLEVGAGIGGVVGSLLTRSGWPAIGALTVFGMERMGGKKRKPMDDRAICLKTIDIKGKDTRISHGRIGPVVSDWIFEK